MSLHKKVSKTTLLLSATKIITKKIAPALFSSVAQQCHSRIWRQEWTECISVLGTLYRAGVWLLVEKESQIWHSLPHSQPDKSVSVFILNYLAFATPSPHDSIFIMNNSINILKTLAIIDCLNLPTLWFVGFSGIADCQFSVVITGFI